MADHPAGRAGQAVRPGVFNFDPRHLARYRAVLRRVAEGAGRAKVLDVGDSTTHGYGGGSSPPRAGAAATAFPAQLVPILQRLTGLAHEANGFLGSSDEPERAYASYDPRVTLPPSWGSVGPPCVGGSVFTTMETSEALSFRPSSPFDRADVYYVSDEAEPPGRISVHADDGSVLAILDGRAPAGVQCELIAFPSGARTISVRALDSGRSVRLVGIDAWNSRALAVSQINAGWGGAQASWWAVEGPAGPLAGIRAFRPDLTRINLGINDWRLGVPLEGYLAGMRQIIATAQLSGDVLLLIPFPTDDRHASPAVQLAYAAAIRRLATDHGCVVVDLMARFGSWRNARAGKYAHDSLHPSARGYAEIARAIAPVLAF